MLVSLWTMLTGCSFVLIDEPCDSGEAATSDTAVVDDRSLWIDIAVGGAHTCALDVDGRTACWGSDGYGQSAPPPTPFTALSLGYAHSCALDSVGGVHCWGRNDDGETNVPEGEFISLSAGGAHTCALTGLGDAVCWGRGIEGQLEVPDGIWRSMDAGWDHTCGLDMDGGVRCWGNIAPLDSLPLGPFSSVSSGQYFGCVLDAGGQGWCSGSFEENVLDAVTQTEIAAGLEHVCTTNASGGVQCFGEDSVGQLSVPDRPMHGVSASPGGLHICGLEGAGTQPSPAICWGLDDEGQATP